MYIFKYKLDAVACTALNSKKVTFTVLEQDSKFDKFENQTIFTSSNGWKIRRVCTPEISTGSRTIYIKGRELGALDLKIISDVDISLIHFALKEFLEKFCEYKQNNHPLTKIFV